MLTIPFPRLSPDTARAAEAALGKGNAYLLIGSSVKKLFADIDLSSLYTEERVPGEFPYMLSLVTLFQSHEGMDDRQAAEATRVRVDWKYALHLPLLHPGLRPTAMCDFRLRLFASESGQLALQQVMKRLQDRSILADGFWLPYAESPVLLTSICVRTRLELVLSTVQATVQALVATENGWLRGIACAHWYQRYSRDLSTLSIPEDVEGQVALAEMVGADGFYLLKAIAETNPQLAICPEVQTLQRVLDNQFERDGSLYKLRVSKCPVCVSQPG